MMPLGDDDSRRASVPLVTYGLIALNILFFFIEMSGGEPFVIQWSFVPARFLADPVAGIPTLFTSMFMHAGIGHIAGNMLYLWIFGDNVEDNFGKIPFLVFYLLSGLGATFLQLVFSATSTIPNLGASGAIAGVLGAYMFLYPQSKVRVLVGNAITAMPALLVIGFWFALQFLSGIGSLSNTQDKGGVAYMAHIGGFVAGFLLTPLFRSRQQNV
jgi:membrane associated rhomboid family serine protease